MIRFNARATRRRYSDGDVDVTFDKLPCENRIPIELLRGKLVQEYDVLALDVTEIAKRLYKHREVLTLLFRAAGMPEYADFSTLPARLCLRCERPRQCGCAKKHNELASPHLTLHFGWSPHTFLACPPKEMRTNYRWGVGGIAASGGSGSSRKWHA